MAIARLLCSLLLGSAVCGQLLQRHNFTVLPEKGRVRGVFEVTAAPLPYAFNASVAKAVCEHLGVAFATKAQVEEAHMHGLETCRYGWVRELTAVLPRITAARACGQGAVGVLQWKKGVDSLFDAFCFNATDLEMLSEPVAAGSPTATELWSTPRLFPSSRPSPSGSPAARPSTSTAEPTLASQDVSERMLLPAVSAVLVAFAAVLLLLAAVISLRHRRMKRLRVCNGDHRKAETGDRKQANEKDAGGHLGEADGNSNDIGLAAVPETQPGSP